MIATTSTKSAPGSSDREIVTTRLFEAPREPVFEDVGGGSAKDAADWQVFFNSRGGVREGEGIGYGSERAKL